MGQSRGRAGFQPAVIPICRRDGRGGTISELQPGGFILWGRFEKRPNLGRFATNPLQTIVLSKRIVLRPLLGGEMITKANCWLFRAFLGIIFITSLQLAATCEAQVQTGTGSTGRATSVPTDTPTAPIHTGIVTVTVVPTVRPTGPPVPTNTSSVRPRFPTWAATATATATLGRGGANFSSDCNNDTETNRDRCDHRSCDVEAAGCGWYRNGYGHNASP